MLKRSVLAAAVFISMGVAAAPAHAKDVDVTGTASCTGGVAAKIKAGPRDTNRMKSNVQIDDVGTIARSWTITIVDGAQTQTKVRTTAGTSNSIDVDFFTTDNAGADTVTFTATRVGASCSGTVTV